MFERILKSKLAQNSMWMLLLQFFSTIMPMLTLPYITRVLSKSAYGELSLALSYMTYFQVIVEYGFRLSGAKKVAMRKNDDELSDICGNIFFSRLFLMLICLAILVLIAAFAPVNKSLIICMFILFSIIFSLVFQQNWLFQGMAEMKNITIANVVGRLVSVSLIFLFVNRPEHLYLYCAFNAFGTVFASMLSCFLAIKKYKVRIIKFNGLLMVFNELKEGWALFVSTAIGSLIGSIGITILGFIETTDIVGVYSAVSKIPYVLNMIFAAFSQALYPIYCKGYAKSFNEGIKLLKKYAVPIVMFFLLCGIVIIALRENIVKIAFGVEYISGALLLIPFTIWTILGIVNNFLGIQTLVANGYSKEYSRAFVISVGFMIVLMFGLGRCLGALGVALASMFSEMLLTLMLTRYILRVKVKSYE